MANIIEIADFSSPELDVYARLTEGQLRSRQDSEKSLFIAESPKVIQRALDAGGGYVQENAALLVGGRISVRDEKEPQLMVDTIRPLTDLNPLGADEPRKEKKLWVRLPGRNDARLKRIELVLTMFPGEDRMVIVFDDGSKRLGTKCIIHDALVRELRELLGSDNVVIR